MKKFITCLLAALGLTSACGQQHFENTDVEGFSNLIDSTDVILLDVRTVEEFAEAHICGALNIDQRQPDFLSKAKALLPAGKTIAVYCRSGRRSASAAERLTAEGYKCVNLKGGILAWQQQQKPVTTDTFEIDVFLTPGGKTVKLYALCHASIRIDYDGKAFFIDPVTKLGDKVIDYSPMPKADYLFVTHEHFDHFDRDAIAALSHQHTCLVTNSRCATMLGKGEIMSNGDVLAIAGDITLEAVPAYNTTEQHLQFHPKGRDNGFVLTFDGLRIYIASDTEDIPEMAALHNIDIAFMPCNQPYTMTVNQLLNAARTVKPKVLFPYHFGQTDVTTIPALLEADGIEVRLRHYE